MCSGITGGEQSSSSVAGIGAGGMGRYLVCVRAQPVNSASRHRQTSTVLRRNVLTYLDDTRLEILHRVLMCILCHSGYLVKECYCLFIVAKLCAGGVTLDDHRLVGLLQASDFDVLDSHHDGESGDRREHRSEREEFPAHLSIFDALNAE